MSRSAVRVRSSDLFFTCKSYKKRRVHDHATWGLGSSRPAVDYPKGLSSASACYKLLEGTAGGLGLILVGRDDFVCPPSQAKIMHEGIPNSQLVVFEKSGHFAHVEEPEAFLDAVRGWLNRA